MKSKRPRKLVVLLIGMIACGAVWPGLVYEDRTHYRCQVCFAKQERVQWWFGRWEFFAIPLAPASEQVKASKFLNDFLPRHTAHTWRLAGESPYYWGVVWGGCVIGGGKHLEPAISAYESNPKFRDYIRKEMQKGALDRTTVIKILSATCSDSESAKAGQRLLEEFQRAR